MPLLSAERISKRFGSLVAVRDVSVDLETGEILGLIGPNGAGKTTLFNIIAGKYKPDGGKINFDGQRIDGKKPFEICHLGIARTYQLVKPFLAETVFENVLLGAAFGNKSTRDSAEAAEDAIALVGLDELRDRYIFTLPFIDRRKVELAKAISTGARLVLLDEPMAGLNPSEVSQFIQIVQKMNTSRITVFIIEHVMHAIMSLCSRIVVLDHGEKIAEGSGAQISQNAKVIQAYLGSE